MALMARFGSFPVGVGGHTTNTSNRSWWAAMTVGTELVGAPGAHRSLVFDVGDTDEVFVAFFSIDDSDIISRMSTYVSTNGGTGRTTAVPPSTPPVRRVYGKGNLLDHQP